ncbi:hypothetical protein [Streptomyces sp. CBMA29]|uniref:hypothetical protein n=1 Tax=Streptomyces sp. CBMA29 TaxID=1896314 RepID=UPI0016619048|nr:hypothetical protein [Streptomyces sp. CBMA29]MBD0734004.1 hypothetical protein [Streptomyces sp. CBMA29]
MNDFVVGYQFDAEILCPTHTIAALRASGIKVQAGKAHEDAIRKAAENMGINFSDEGSYDPGDFPKIATRQNVLTEITERPDGETAIIQDERCGSCGKWLIEGEKSPPARTVAKLLAKKYDLPIKLAKGVQAELQEWGYTHPEHVSEDDVRLAARRVRHDFLAVALAPGYPKVRELREYDIPQYNDHECAYCDGAYEDHKVTCSTCKAAVGAAEVHRHFVQIDGQRMLPTPRKR